MNCNLRIRSLGITVGLRVDYGLYPTRCEAVRSSTSRISHSPPDDWMRLCCGARLTSVVGCGVINYMSSCEGWNVDYTCGKVHAL
jgi:hypothetical protein